MIQCNHNQERLYLTKTKRDYIMTKSNNKKVSDAVHYNIPVRVREIVNGHLLINERLMCQHNREILDEIIEDLIMYRDTLPSVSDLEVCNVI